MRPLPRLRSALAPTAVWLTDEGLSGVAVHLANDGPEPLAARLRIGLYRGFEQAVGEVVKEVELPDHSASSLDLEAMLGRFVDASWAYRFGPAAQDAIVAVLEAPGDEPAPPLAEALHFPAGRPSGAESAARLSLEATAEAAPDGSVTLSLRAQRLVWGLRAQCPGWSPRSR